MPFWKKKPPDPNIEAARAEAEAALPPGWEIRRSDLETFRIPTGRIYTYGICAAGPGPHDQALVIAVGEANAYRYFARFMRGEFEPAEGWAVPLEDVDPKKSHGSFHVRNEEDPDVVAAQAELDAALPAGWELYDNDRERYFFPGGYLKTYAVAAGGPSGEAALVMGLGEAGGYRQLSRRLRGELEITDSWAPPMDTFTGR